jgi:FixJ family two-component response regulator
MQTDENPRRDRCCIVLVDDDPGIRDASARMLRLCGYDPLVYPSAEAFLAAGGAVRPACLVLDIHLPGLSGFELYARIARLGKPPPVIFMTAYDGAESRAAAAAAAGYLAKPFSGQHLVAAVERALSKPDVPGTSG